MAVFYVYILEVMAKSDVSDFSTFKTKVKACKPVTKGPVLSYSSIYGDTLTLDSSFKKTPTVNGKPVKYKGDMVFDSPFLKSKYDSGIITIQKGKRKRVLNFNELVD